MVSVRLTTDSWARVITPEKEQPIIKNYYLESKTTKISNDFRLFVEN
jgi:hypothetical protein